MIHLTFPYLLRTKYPLCAGLGVGGCVLIGSPILLCCAFMFSRLCCLARQAALVTPQEVHKRGLKKAAPLLSSLPALCHLPSSVAEQLAQQIALAVEMYMYKISPPFFYFAWIKWHLMKKTWSEEAVATECFADAKGWVSRSLCINRGERLENIYIPDTKFRRSPYFLCISASSSWVAI